MRAAEHWLAQPSASGIALAGSMMYEREQVAATRDALRYTSINSMQKADKINALKDTSLDPSKLLDHFDAHSNILYRWKAMASDPRSQALSPEEKTQHASWYYDNFIAPSYQQMGTAPMPKSQWMQEAYGQALKYDIADSYHSSLVHGVLSGTHSGVASVERAVQFVTDVAGYGSKLAADAWTKKDFNWSDEYYALMAGARKTGSLMGGVEERAKTTAPLSAVGRILGMQDTTILSKASKMFGETASRHQFMEEIVPNRDVIEKATSFITEQALMMPLYMAADGAAGVIAKSGGAIAPKTLTEMLSLTPKGQAASKLLRAGAEGGLVGITARSNEEKGEAWKDVLSWMAMHTMFSVGTVGLGKASVKLGELLGGRAKDKFDKLDAEYRLNEKDMRSQNSTEVAAGAEENVANSMMAGGVATPYYHYKQAESVLRKAQASNLSEKELAKNMDILIRYDEDHWQPAVAAMKHIRSLVEDGVVPEAGSEAHQNMWGAINNTIKDAAEHMHEHVAPLEDAAGDEAYKAAASTPKGQAILEQMYQKHKLEWESSGHPPMKEEEYRAIVSQEYKESNKWMAKESERERAKTPAQAASEAKGAADQVAAHTRAAVNEAAAALRRRESFFKDPKGKVIGYSMSYSKSYNVYALEKGGESAKTTEAAFNSYLKSYLTDLSPKDFSEDLNDYWLPKVLQEEGITFETENVEGGKENPNLLAFAWNYKDAMPAPLRAELEKRLFAQPKMQAAVDESSPLTHDHLQYFADTMLGHVDEFMRARHLLPDQTKVWRSSNDESFMKPTRWQMILQGQVEKLEREELKAACGGDERLNFDVQNLFGKLKALQEKRKLATQKGIRSLHSGSDRLDYSDQIQDLLSSAEER